MDNLTSFLIGLLVLALAASLAIVVARLRVFQRERRELEQKVGDSEEQAREDSRRLEAVLGLNRLIGDAKNEQEVIDRLLRSSIDLVRGMGASFVPLDERGQPLAAISLGAMPVPNFEPWVEYLASPSVRQRCAACQNHETVVHDCPLLKTYLDETDDLLIPALNVSGRDPSSPAEGVYCLPVRWSGREFGVMNVYLPAGSAPDTDAQEFLRTIVESAALVIESVRLRNRESTALSQLQALRQRNDMSELFSGYLENLRETLPADFILLIVHEINPGQFSARLTSGNPPLAALPFMDNIAEGVFKVGEPVLLGDVAFSQASSESLRSLIAAPLQLEGGPVLGVILAGNQRPPSFTQRQLMVLRAEAARVALVVHNTRLVAEVEYNTMMAERTRLAREIHDGLAQTLGFLKLHTAQMQTSLGQSDLERLRDSLQTSYKILTEAYNETRLAIDSLRIVPESEGLLTWLRQTAEEFEETSGIPVELLDLENAATLPLEIQAQLIRIVQEALSNVRKHAQASHAWVVARTDGNDLIIDIRDDGRGFSPQDVPGPSRYGLQGMRERAELIGGDFQVTSGSQRGTIVSLRLPLILDERAR